MTQNPNDAGLRAEALAATYLEQKGYRILDRRFRCRGGEIDLVCVKETEIVFAEVRYRAALRYGTPLETVGKAKQQRLSRAIGFYLTKHGKKLTDFSFRCDVVALSGPLSAPCIEHYENVFVPCFG